MCGVTQDLRGKLWRVGVAVLDNEGAIKGAYDMG